jgi:AcrR family transcriptional regulator
VVYGVNVSTRERIAEAARRIVVEEGSAAVSMRRVGKSVGLSQMATYRHYPSRDALLAAVADACFAELAEGWGGHPWSGDDDGALERLLTEHLDFALGQPHLYVFLFTENRTGARAFPHDFRSGASPTLTPVADALTAGVRRGVFVPHDVWEVALSIAAQLHGLVEMYHGGRIGLAESEFRALCSRAVERILDGVRR